jgi:uncharacterized Rmd1/YagE family protein
MKFFNARRETYNTNPQLIDEVIYTPYSYNPASPQIGQGAGRGTEVPPTGDLLGMPDLLSENGASPHPRKRSNKFTETPSQAEIFLFEYGTAVLWGMTETEEKRFLSSMCEHFSLPLHILFTSEFPESDLRLNDWVSFGFELLSVTGFRLRYALETPIVIRPSRCANLMGSPGRH